MKNRKNIKKNNDNMWKKYLGSYFVLFVLVILLALSAQNAKTTKNIAHAQEIISPLPTQTVQKKVGEEPRLPANPTPSVTATGAEGEIKQQIRTVFGQYADKAILLLTSPKCHENGSFNPEAVNHNTDGSTDYGVMQLNDNWWGFKREVNNPEMLFDYKINVLIAYHIFKHDGYSFKAWTCGKELGI